MCGDDATEKIDKNWKRYVPKILEHGGLKINESEGINEQTMLKTIQIMDKNFRPLGAAAKSDAAFTIYEVLCMCVRVCICNKLCMVLVLRCSSLFESCSPTLMLAAWL